MSGLNSYRRQSWFPTSSNNEAVTTPFPPAGTEIGTSSIAAQGQTREVVFQPSTRAPRDVPDTAVSPFIGVVRLTIQSSHINQRKKLLGGLPDPFLVVSREEGKVLGRDRGGGEEKVWFRTAKMENTLDPTWMETHFIPVKSLLSQTKLRFDLYDHHEHIRRHTLLGSGILDYSCLNGTGMENWQHSGVRVLLRKDEVGVEGGLGKDKGEVLCDLSFYETEEEVRKRRLKEMEEEERKRKEQGISEQEHASQKKRRSIFGAPVAGILSISLVQAQDLDLTNPHSSFVAEIRTKLDGPILYSTPHPASTSSPTWHGAQHSFFSPHRDINLIVNVVDIGGEAERIKASGWRSNKGSDDFGNSVGLGGAAHWDGERGGGHKSRLSFGGVSESLGLALVGVEHARLVKGTLSINIEDVLMACGAAEEDWNELKQVKRIEKWWPLSGCQRGKLKLEIIWTPIDMKS